MEKWSEKKLFDIPEESFHSGILEVAPMTRYDAEQAVREYHANCTVCTATKRRMAFYRLGFLFAALLCTGEQFLSAVNSSATIWKTIVAAGWLVLAVYSVFFPKNLLAPAIGLLLLVICGISWWVPAGGAAVLAFFHEKNSLWLQRQPGFPDFHPVAVKVQTGVDLTERHVPPPSDPEPDPYRDILSDI